MRKYLLFLNLIVLCLLNACHSFVCGPVSEVGNGDWAVRFNNDYAIWHVSSDCIILGKEDDSHSSLSHVIDSYISAFRYNENYIIVERLAEGKNKKDIKEYYVIDTVCDKIHGPYTEKTLEVVILNKQLGALSDWVPTSPKPAEAVFD